MITGAIYLDQDHKQQNLSISIRILLLRIYVILSRTLLFNVSLRLRESTIFMWYVEIYYFSNCIYVYNAFYMIARDDNELGWSIT